MHSPLHTCHLVSLNYRLILRKESYQTAHGPSLCEQSDGDLVAHCHWTLPLQILNGCASFPDLRMTCQSHVDCHAYIEDLLKLTLTSEILLMASLSYFCLSFDLQQAFLHPQSAPAGLITVDSWLEIYTVLSWLYSYNCKLTIEFSIYSRFLDHTLRRQARGVSDHFNIVKLSQWYYLPWKLNCVAKLGLPAMSTGEVFTIDQRCRCNCKVHIKSIGGGWAPDVVCHNLKSF